MNTAAACTFAAENFATFWRDCQPLLDAHYAEIGTFQDIPLNPDREFYERVEAGGNLRIYTARAAGELIGYAVFFIGPNPHYASSLQANADVVYLYPEWRKGGLGSQLLKYSELELRSEGMEVIYHHVKKAHPVLGKLLEHDGYKVMDLVYAKRLK